MTSMDAPASPVLAVQPAATPTLAWHRRLVQALLYGRNVDRDKKARARLGLAVVGFFVIYCIIAGKLVIFAIAPESHAGRRVGSDAVATARPDILDRNGEILAIVSEPDYNPNNPREALDPSRINRITTGVYEMGSTFKALTVAMALDSGKVTLK